MADNDLSINRHHSHNSRHHSHLSTSFPGHLCHFRKSYVIDSFLSILGPGGPGTLKVQVNSTFHWTNIYGFSFFLSIKEVNWIDGISSSNSSIPEAREDNRSESQLQSNVDGNSVGFFLYCHDSFHFKSFSFNV